MTLRTHARYEFNVITEWRKSLKNRDEERFFNFRDSVMAFDNRVIVHNVFRTFASTYEKNLL
jgi:hypothetical protein